MMGCSTLITTVLLVSVLVAQSGAEEEEHEPNQLIVYSLYKLHACEADQTPILHSSETAFKGTYFNEEEVEEIETESQLWMYNEDPFGAHHWAFARGPFSWGFVILIAIITRMVWGEIPFIGEKTPESVVEIVVGFVAGIIFDYGYNEPDYLGFDSEQFFFYILPWIILEAGYSINNYYVVQHLWTILLHAVFGTLFNVALIGSVMWGVAEAVGVEGFRLDHGLLFGSFIAAVDPVAVLSVLTEFHVHPSVNAIVGGESLLNDGVAVVVYRVMVAVAYSESYFKEEPTSLAYGEVVGLAMLQMVLVFTGGALVGAATGVLSCYVLKRFLDLCTHQSKKRVATQKQLKRQAKHDAEAKALLECEGSVKFNPSKNTRKAESSLSEAFLTQESKFDRVADGATSPRPGRNGAPGSPTTMRRSNIVAAKRGNSSDQKLVQLEEFDNDDDDFVDDSGEEDGEEEGTDGGLVELVPILVILLGYLGYLFSESIRFTGIVTIMVYGMVVNHYEHYCMTDKHIEQLKYILGVAAHTSDSVVFLIVGQQFWVACSRSPQGWNAGFIVIAYLITNAGRSMGVIGFGWIDNYVRGQEHKKKIPMKDLALLSFGGLRGAIAFALVYTLVDEKFACIETDEVSGRRSTEAFHAIKIFPHKDLLLTTTVMLVILTVFIQGTLAGTVVQLLHTDREHAETTFDLTNNTLMEHLQRGFGAVAEPQHRWRLGWLFQQALTSVEGLLKNKNYHFLTRFHYHAKSKVRERQAEAFQILKAHYFTAHDHAQEMVTLAHRKNMSPTKIAQVKANMQQYIQDHLLMAMREQVQNHSTFHQNIAKAMVDAHDEAALELEDFSDSKAKFKAFHRIIRNNVRHADFQTDDAKSNRARRQETSPGVTVTGFKVGADGIELQEGQGAIKDNFRQSFRQSIKRRRFTVYPGEPPKAWRKSSWTTKQVRRKMSLQLNSAKRSASLGASTNTTTAEMLIGVAARDSLVTESNEVLAMRALIKHEQNSEISGLLATLREEVQEGSDGDGPRSPLATSPPGIDPENIFPAIPETLDEVEEDPTPEEERHEFNQSTTLTAREAPPSDVRLRVAETYV